MADNQLRIAQPELPLLQVVLSPPSAEILTPAGGDTCSLSLTFWCLVRKLGG